METQIKKESKELETKTQGVPYDVYLKELKQRMERLERKTDELTTRLTAMGERLVDILETLAKQPGVKGEEREKIAREEIVPFKRLQKPESDLEILADQIESKLEERVKEKEKEKEKAKPEEVSQVAEKLSKEETAPPPPKKKVGIFQVLNELLIGEEEEEY